jgi:Xaa-Pro dipeptidase
MKIFEQRQQWLQDEMRKRGWSGFLVTHNVDIYYYCGSMQTGYLFIPTEGEVIYLVRRSLVRAEEEAAAVVEALGSWKTLGERLRARIGGDAAAGDPLRIATELDVLPVQLYMRLQTALPGAVWEDGSLLVREQRMIK